MRRTLSLATEQGKSAFFRKPLNLLEEINRRCKAPVIDRICAFAYLLGLA
jgi:hypothetical protein